MVERIASWGFVVLAPTVFHRDGRAADLAPAEDLRAPGARERFFAGGVGDRVAGLTPDLSDPDSDLWLATLDEHADGGPIGTTGYCMGARLATRLAGRRPDRVAALGGFHGGGLVTEAPDSPHHALAAARAEVVYGHADADPSMPPEAVAALQEILEDSGRRFSNAVYPGAPHGFTMADTSMYDPAGAQRHDTELRDLLTRTLLTR